MRLVREQVGQLRCIPCVGFRLARVLTRSPLDSTSIEIEPPGQGTGLAQALTRARFNLAVPPLNARPITV